MGGWDSYVANISATDEAGWFKEPIDEKGPLIDLYAECFKLLHAKSAQSTVLFRWLKRAVKYLPIPGNTSTKRRLELQVALERIHESASDEEKPICEEVGGALGFVEALLCCICEVKESEVDDTKPWMEVLSLPTLKTSREFFENIILNSVSTPSASSAYAAIIVILKQLWSRPDVPERLQKTALVLSMTEVCVRKKLPSEHLMSAMHHQLQELKSLGGSPCMQYDDNATVLAQITTIVTYLEESSSLDLKDEVAFIHCRAPLSPNVETSHHTVPKTKKEKRRPSISGESGDDDTDRPSTARYYRQAYANAPPNTPVAIIDDVWIQVDAVVNRILPKDGKEPSDELMSSYAPGQMVITTSQITWTIDTAKAIEALKRMGEEPTLDVGDDPPLVISLDTIKTFTSEKINQRFGGYSLTVKANSVVKFYAFSDKEVQELVEALKDLTGQAPVNDEKFVRQIVEEKMDVARNNVSKSLHYDEQDYLLTKPDEIQAVVARLIMEGRQQSMRDLEVLYESVLIKRVFLKQALTALKKGWDDHSTESVKLKILSVLERLISRSLIEQGDNNFTMISQWLPQMEGVLDPYKNVRSMKVLHTLRQQIDDVKKQLVGPISEELYPKQFQYLNEYEAYMRQQHVPLEAFGKKWIEEENLEEI